MKQKFEEIITHESEFREIMGTPSELVTKKSINYIDENCKLFIEQSPFIVISSSDQNGNFDASPKGAPPGFVKVLDNKTLAIPDRLGNRRADTFMNILVNPKVGLIFLIPGIKETLRVSGGAQIVKDKKVLELLAHNNKLPKLALIVHVEEAFLHCAKCIIRSKLWAKVDLNSKRKAPTLAKSMVDHGNLDKSYEEMEAIIKNDEKIRLY
jgi:PPOX class probable FMN-dependent enzyme